MGEPGRTVWGPAAIFIRRMFSPSSSVDCSRVSCWGSSSLYLLHPLSTRPPPSAPRLCSSTFSPPKHKHTLLLLSTETFPKNMQSALKALVYQQSLTQWCEESPNCSNQDRLASQVVLNYVLKYKSKVGLRWWNRPYRNLTCPWCFTKRKPVQQSSAASIKGSGHTPTPNWSGLVPLDIRRLLRF